MSFFHRFLNVFNPNEEKLNSLVNSSFLGSFYNLFTRFFAFLSGRLAPNSFFVKNLDNIYFLVLAVLIFALPFAKSGMLGLIACILVFISLVNSLCRHKKFHFSSIHVPVFFYLAVILISVGFSSLFLPSLKGFVKILIYIFAFFSFFEFLKKNPEKIFPVILLIALSSCLELLFSLKQMIFGVEALASWQDTNHVNAENLMNRVFGTLKPFNPNLFASYLLASVPSIFAVFLYSFMKGKFKISILFALFLLLSLITILQTGCRGAYIALFFAALFLVFMIFKAFKHYFIQRRSLKKIILLSAFLIVLCAVFVIFNSPSLLHRLESIFTLRGDSSNSYRMNVYISSLKIFFDNFWIGIGPGNTTYRLIYGLYMVTGFDALGAYNIYLEMAVESGIFAPIAFLWMIFLTFFKSLKRLFDFSVKYKIISIACLSAIIAMLVHGFFDTIWYRPQIQLLFWLYLAILAVVTMKGFANEQK